MDISEKIVIFDWGGIVENHENNLQDLKQAKIRFIRTFNKGLSDEEILNKWIDETPNGVHIGASNNPKHMVEWFELMEQIMNINTTFEEFKRAYQAEFSKIRYYKDVAEFAHSLKEKCKIGILSNLMPFDKARIDLQYDLSKFDYVYLSFEIGYEKPDKRAYEYVLNDLQIKPENILFIDDDVNNVIGAKKCNWNVFQGQGYKLEEIKNSVYKFLAEK